MEIDYYKTPIKEDIETSIHVIEEDYNTCFRMIRRIYDYLDRFGLKEFNKYSKYKWNYDRDRSREYSYVCIRYGNSLIKKCLIKKRSHVDTADLYRWIESKELIQEALDEAYEYISEKTNTAKRKMEELKGIMEGYGEKFDDITNEYDEAKQARKVLREELFANEFFVK